MGKNKGIGIFISFEGGEGSGKSTIIKLVSEKLKKLDKEVIITREPGGTDISDQIRNVILNKKNTKMDGITEAYLYAASRRQHMFEKVIPALEENKVVISDRFLDSSIVYQGYVRGYGMENILRINEDAIKDKDGKTVLPDLTIYFDLDPEIGLSRIAQNGEREVNRLDLESLAFHKKVREGYNEWANKNQKRIKIIDASKSVEEVANDVFSLIKEII